MHEINVDLAPALPLDPLKVVTMADYDVQLCLYRTWFDYDSSRKARPGLIDKWTFDSTRGTYNFEIAANSKWSDGSPIEPKHLIANLRRAVSLKTTYGEAIGSIIRMDTIRILSQNSFEIEMRDHQPSENFFQRMGSVFLSPIHPSDWSDDLILKQNTKTSAGYVIEKIEDSGMRLVKNEFYTRDFEHRASAINIRFNPTTKLEEFVTGKAWATVMQTATLMPLPLARAIKEKHLPFWTRGYDRVSLLKPLGKGKLLTERRKFVEAFGAKWVKKDPGALPLNSAKAMSLQPRGYPLFEEFSGYQLCSVSTACNFEKVITVIVRDNPQSDFQIPLFVEVFKDLGVELKVVKASSYWDLVKQVKADPGIDLELVSFGVADPEPATWMGLVMNESSLFVDVEPTDLRTFKQLTAEQNKDREVAGFRSLLTSIAQRGSYVPLFHFSSLSLGQPGISFKNIGELDETVTYSKIIFE